MDAVPHQVHRGVYQVRLRCLVGRSGYDDAMTSPLDPLAGFHALDIRVGTVRRAHPHRHARKPAYVLEIDFGELGLRSSSAQLVENYSTESLVGRQVIAVANLPPRRVAGVVSEVLVLAAVSSTAGTVLLGVEQWVPNGTRIA